LLFYFALRIIRRLRILSLRRLPQVAGPHLPGVTIGGFSLLTAQQLLTFVRRMSDLLAWAAGLFTAYLWLVFVLTRFAYSRPWGEALGAYLTSTVAELALSALGGVPGLFTVVLIFIVTRWVARLVGAFFDAVEAGSVELPWMHGETANPTKRISIALLWLFAIVVAYPYVPGSSSDVFKGVSVFAGLVISLGSSGVVSQAMSGLVLMYSRALKPGDYVRLGETEGTVTTLGMLSTKIRTNKREEVTLPNAVVIGGGVKNYTRLASESGIILHTSVTIGYDTPWRQVEGMLLLAAGRTEGLAAAPTPFVHVTALSDFYVEYQLNAHLLDPSQRVGVLSALHRNILDAFNEYGVQITSPHYVSDPPRPMIVPRERWYPAPAPSPE
nr:mechanosensitive ion channel [Gemmatimonadaceae bacterium]